MTEADYLLIANEYVNTQFVFFSVLFTLETAILVAGYLVSEKLTGIMSLTLLTLYSLAMAWVSGAIYAHSVTISGFVAKIKISEFDFNWHPIVATEGGFSSFFMTLVMFSYLATIFFYLYMANKT
jgi:hypothetical protein